MGCVFHEALGCGALPSWVVCERLPHPTAPFPGACPPSSPCHPLGPGSRSLPVFPGSPNRSSRLTTDSLLATPKVAF